MSIADRTAVVSDRYLDLIRRFPLRPIRTEDELTIALEVIDSLLALPALALDEEDYLDVLGTLVHKYETDEHPMGPVGDASMLEHLIEAKGVTQTAVSVATGIADSTISEVLKGNRFLSRKNIGKLAKYFNISPDVFSH